MIQSRLPRWPDTETGRAPTTPPGTAPSYYQDVMPSNELPGPYQPYILVSAIGDPEPFDPRPGPLPFLLRLLTISGRIWHHVRHR